MSPCHSQGQAEHLDEQLHGKLSFAGEETEEAWKELTWNEGDPAPAAAAFYTMLG